MPTAIASDNVRDQFYAYGDLDMLEVFTQVRAGGADGVRGRRAGWVGGAGWLAGWLGLYI